MHLRRKSVSKGREYYDNAGTSLVHEKEKGGCQREKRKGEEESHLR